jgi:NAD-dependent DNA ligase
MLDSSEKLYIIQSIIETPKEVNFCRICGNELVINPYQSSIEARCTGDNCSFRSHIGFSYKEDIKQIIRSSFLDKPEPKFCPSCGDKLEMIDFNGKTLIDCKGCQNTLELTL